MAALTNTSDSTALNAALDQEFIANFQHDSDRLAEILGIFGTETLAAGTTLKMLKITGTLNNGKTEGTKVGATGTGAVTLGSSSGTSYVDGDEVALSKFSAEYEAVAEVFGVPYRKMTTANAIQKSGYVNAVLKTDQKMLSQVRGGVVSDFFTFLGTARAPRPRRACRPPSRPRTRPSGTSLRTTATRRAASSTSLTARTRRRTSAPRPSPTRTCSA